MVPVSGILGTRSRSQHKSDGKVPDPERLIVFIEHSIVLKQSNVVILQGSFTFRSPILLSLPNSLQSEEKVSSSTRHPKK